MLLGKHISCLVFFLLIGSSLCAQDLEPPDDKKYTIGEILLEKHTIFDEEEGSSFFHRAANALHVLTQDNVIEREFLFKKGDPYRASLLEETERNLRQLGFIAEAHIYVEFHQNQTVTVTVMVRDKFSLSVGASGGFSGGESTFRFLLGESNFLGRGLDIDAQYVYSEEESGIGLSYYDPRFLNSRHKVFASIDLLDDREKYQIGAERPFFSLETLWSWGGSVLYQESHSVFYHAGEEVNRVPTERFGMDTFLQR
ncbi:MAG: POTRA domain-containing protein, partial [Planctomycetota bacterium]|nr:POTRA domain-containing protein [Planctomycetota bacterium]